MPELGITVEGYREFVRAAKKAQHEFGREIRLANKRVAEMVASGARSKASGMGSVAGKTAPSVKALAGQARAQVALGGSGYPFAMGAEFGSVAHKQFKPWRGSGPGAGYFLYPTIRAQARSGELEDAFWDAIDKAVKETFPD